MDCSTPGLPVHHQLPELTQTHVHRWWCHPIISSSVTPFSSCSPSFPASGSFQMSQFFSSGGQSIGVSASASVLPMNIQDWFSLGLTGWISLQSKGLSRVFSNTTVQNHQFLLAALYAWHTVVHGVAKSQTWLSDWTQVQFFFHRTENVIYTTSCFEPFLIQISVFIQYHQTLIPYYFHF